MVEAQVGAPVWFRTVPAIVAPRMTVHGQIIRKTARVLTYGGAALAHVKEAMRMRRVTTNGSLRECERCRPWRRHGAGPPVPLALATPFAFSFSVAAPATSSTVVVHAELIYVEPSRCMRCCRAHRFSKKQRFWLR